MREKKTGQIKFYHISKHYGYIIPDESGEDVWFVFASFNDEIKQLAIY